MQLPQKCFMIIILGLITCCSGLVNAQSDKMAIPLIEPENSLNDPIDIVLDSQGPVKSGDLVFIDYILSVDNGTIYDTSDAAVAQQAGIYDQGISYGPISFVVGGGNVIMGVDNAMIGMVVGETKNVTITPDQAYGEYDASLIEVVPMEILTDSGITPHVGDTLCYNLQPVKVIDILDDGTALIDFNHPLAGKTIHISITLQNILSYEQLDDPDWLDIPIVL